MLFVEGGWRYDDPEWEIQQVRNTEAKSWQEIKQKQLCREIVEEDAEFVGAWGSQTAIAAWTGQSIDMFEEGEVFIYEALEPRTYGCMGVVLVPEVLNSLVLTCSLEAKAGEVEITFTNMAGAAVHVTTVQWSRPLTMRRIRKAAIDYAILTEQVRSQNQVVVVVEGCCKA